MGNSQQRRWSWSSALVGAATTGAAAAILWGRPRDPSFHLISITLSSLHLRRRHLTPALDLELALNVHVTNPNIAPVCYAPATVSIHYAGSLLGSAHVDAGAQPPMSCTLLRLPARLDGVELAQHATAILADAARRKMELDASVDIAGDAKVLFWSHRFSVHMDSHVVVDPVLLEVIDQENRSEMQLYLA